MTHKAFTYDPVREHSCGTITFYRNINTVVFHFHLYGLNKAPAWCSLVMNRCPGAGRLPSETWTGTKGTLQSSSLAVLGGAWMPSAITVSLTSTTPACCMTSSCLQIIFPMFFLLILPPAFHPKSQPFAELGSLHTHTNNAADRLTRIRITLK